MHHFMIDGFRGYRSRFDDIRLIHELLQEIPFQLGLRAVMPPFLLPYYDGVDLEDVGISGFVFLAGGHLTIHTFSYRECFFADLVVPTRFDVAGARARLSAALPCEVIVDYHVDRRESPPPGLIEPADPKQDFGPHYMLDLEGYRGPSTFESLFEFLDGLPGAVDMTPIMRPYVVPGESCRGRVLSAITMIAESHVALHVFPDAGTAHFDLFSCRFFDVDTVLPRIRCALPAESAREALTARGRRYRTRRTERGSEVERARAWLGGG